MHARTVTGTDQPPKLTSRLPTDLHVKLQFARENRAFDFEMSKSRFCAPHKLKLSISLIDASSHSTCRCAEHITPLLDQHHCLCFPLSCPPFPVSPRVPHHARTHLCHTLSVAKSAVCCVVWKQSEKNRRKATRIRGFRRREIRSFSIDFFAFRVLPSTSETGHHVL